MRGSKNKHEVFELFLLPVAMVLIFTLGVSQALPLLNEEPQVMGAATSGEKSPPINLMGIILIFGAAILLLVLISGIFGLVANLDRI